MSAPDGLTSVERSLWAAWLEAARAWRAKPGERRAADWARASRSVYTAPVPRNLGAADTQALMRAVIDARDFGSRATMAREDLWTRVVDVIGATEAALARAAAPAAPAPTVQDGPVAGGWWCD